jgi:LacI family transcriptional regulator
MKPVSIRDVAQRAGVSVATVSNVVNRPEIVATATRQRVQAAIEELGYVRNIAAHQLSTGRGSAVGLVLFDVRNPFMTDLARGAEDLLYDSGHVVVLCNTDVSARKEERYLELLAQQRAQGVLVTPAALSHEWLARQRERGLRVILFQTGTQDFDACSVEVDDVAGADLAVTHLLARGHREITFLTGPLTMRQSVDRLAGCRQALARAGHPEDALRVVEVGAFTVDQGRRGGERLLASADRGPAVACANDLLALGLMQTAFRAGLRVPDDLAIVGFDDIDSAATAGVPLTSVHVDGYALGRTAAELLLDEVRSPDHTHRHLLFPPRLVERSST